MTLSLRFQDPTSSSTKLLDLILDAAENSDRGAGIFSFASYKGVSLLLADSVFENFLLGSKFNLLVGVDAVTDPAALKHLQDAQNQYANLRARAFFHSHAAATFHPKLAWFASGEKCRVFVGSGNLTRGGLLNNWEAFGDIELDETQFDNFESVWNSWFCQNREHLFELNDQHVTERARRNKTENLRRPEEYVIESGNLNPSEAPAGANVLVAEIPRGSTRWNQANFDLENFVTFFQLSRTESRRVELTPVSSDGTVGTTEVRPSIAVASSNYRIELGLASNLNYPDSDRPIAVFLRIGIRRFRYRLLMPQDADHQDVSSFLNTRCHSQPSHHVKRTRIRLEEFEHSLPGFRI